MATNDRTIGRLESKIENIAGDISEIKQDQRRDNEQMKASIAILLQHKVKSETEIVAMQNTFRAQSRRTATWVAAITTGAIGVTGEFIKAWWISKNG